MHSPLIQADWPAHPWLVHGFGTRFGSLANHDAPNQGNALVPSPLYNEDQLENSCSAMTHRWSLITLKQTHSSVVHSLASRHVGHIGSEGRTYGEGDGLITDQPGILLGIQTADCVPVLIADVRTRVVGAFHAGWRGTVAGIVGRGVLRMSADFGSDPDNLIAAIGPSIGPCCYAVGNEVRTAFTECLADGHTLFHEVEEDSANPRLDLWEANRRQLLAAGLPPEQISVVAQCTACSYEPDGQRRFFSYRSEAGMTGRMMSVIGIREK